MHNLTHHLAPGATKLIRIDHTHAITLFHRYSVDAAPERKKAIVESACLALEIHSQLEEELFYPALREVAASNEALQKAEPEHAEIKRLIGTLRELQPTDPEYDLRFHELMRDVLHHVADEESVLLPAAELLLKDRLGELGAQMTRRRFELAGPRMGEIAGHTIRAMPGATMLMAGGLLAGGLLLKKAFEHRRH
jgi:hemerythrin superfamily protein